MLLTFAFAAGSQPNGRPSVDDESEESVTPEDYEYDEFADR